MTVSQSSLTLRVIEPGAHRPALLRMYHEVLGGDAGERQFRWKYEECSDGAMVVASAWDTSRAPETLAGAFSAYRRLFLHKGEVVTAFQDADAMVDGAYRGQGLFRRLTDLLNTEVQREGAPFHFGYSNGQSSPLLRRRADVRMLTLSRSFAFPIGFANAASAHLRLTGVAGRAATAAGGLAIGVWNTLHGYGRPNRLSMEPVDRFDDLPLTWSRDNARYYKFFPLRTAGFLNWRAIDVPPELKSDTLPFWMKEEGRRVGYCVLYRNAARNVLKLLDVVCEEPERKLALCIAAIRAYAIANHFDVVTTNVAGALHQRSLLACGFRPVSEVVSYLIITDPKVMEDIACDADFWLQLPIDRDNFEY